MMVRTLSAEPAGVSPWMLVRKRALDYLALTKPRVVAMVLITASVGFYLASPGPLHWLLLCHALIGVALAAGGTLALNQYLERDLDARMLRTKERPLPEGRLQPGEALGFGVAITASGLLLDHNGEPLEWIGHRRQCWQLSLSLYATQAEDPLVRLCRRRSGGLAASDGVGRRLRPMVH